MYKQDVIITKAKTRTNIPSCNKMETYTRTSHTTGKAKTRMEQEGHLY